MITAIAIDDEPPALRVMENFCDKTDLITLQKTFTQPKEAIRYLEGNQIDLLFLDIQMPSISGIDLYKSLNKECMIIFTTAFSEYAVEGFELNAVDYLLKPFTFDRFEKAVIKANEYKNFKESKGTSESYFYVRADFSLVKINITDILFIEGLDDYLKIHLTTHKPVVARMTMKKIMERLPANEFVRVHRSFIIPLSRINSIKNKSITIGEHQIAIGNTYEEEFYKLFNKK